MYGKRNNKSAKRNHQRSPIRLETLEGRENPSGIVAVGADPGSAPIVTIYDASTQTVKFTITAYDSSFTGGVNVAIGDVDGDGTPDVITGTGDGGGPEVRIFSGVDGTQIGSYLVGDSSSRVGVTVAAADFDSDGQADIVVGSMQNGSPLVQVLRGTDGTLLNQYTPMAGATSVNVTAGDVNGDGTPDVIVAAGRGGGPRVTVYDGSNDQVLYDFFTFEETFTGGVHVSVGDLNQDGMADIITAASLDGGPRVQVYSGQTGTVLQNYFAYDSETRNGVRAFAFDADGDGTIDLVTSEGVGIANNVKAFNASTLTEVSLITFTALPVSAEAVDAAAPTVVVTTTAGTSSSATPLSFTATFSEAVNGFSTAGITVTNGVVSNFVAVSAKVYTFDVTPSAEGDVTVVVIAGAVTDVMGYGNTSTGSITVAYDLSSPVVTIDALTTANSLPKLTGTVSDSTSTVTVQVAGQVLNATVSGTSWSVTLTEAVSDGTYNIYVTATDAAGYTGDATLTSGLIVDTTAPGIALTTEADETTSSSPIPFTATFSEDVTGFTAEDLVVSNGSVTNFVIVDARTYTFAIVPDANGMITVSIGASAASDLAGSGNAGSETVSVAYDLNAPLVTIEAVMTSATTPTLTGTVSDENATVIVQVAGVSVTATVSGTTWTATVSDPLTDDTYDIVVSATNTNGQTGTTTRSSGLTVDTIAPTVVLESSAAETTTSNPIPWTAVFNETVYEFDASDLVVTNGTVANFATSDNLTFTFEVIPASEGIITVTIPASVANDAAGNASQASETVSRTYSMSATGVSITTTAGNPTAQTTIPVTVTFETDATGFDAADVIVANGSLSDFAEVDAKTFTFNVTPMSSGEVTVSIEAGIVYDAQGYPSDSASLTIIYDPSVSA